MKFNPEVLISFNTKLDIINNFPKLIQDDTLIDSCINNIISINTTYKCKAMLMNKTNSKLFIKSNLYPDSINRNKEVENIDRLIAISIKKMKNIPN